MGSYEDMRVRGLHSGLPETVPYSNGRIAVSLKLCILINKLIYESIHLFSS